MKFKGIIFLLTITAIMNAQIKTGYDVIEAMHNKYKNSWYKYFTFTQDAVFYKDGKEEKTEVWYEAAMFPGNLIIKYDSLTSKSGVVFSDNKVTAIKEGVVKPSKPFIHDLLLVGFDVYFLNPTTSSKLLDSLGYNLKLVREGEFEGRKVYIVGAEKGDTLSKQFWIDKERLLMHKIIYKKGDNLIDVVFSDYVKMEGKWVAKKVIFKNNGILQLIEKYYNIKFPTNLSPSLFDPLMFTHQSW